MAEQPVPLQVDTITAAPGGGIRAITALVMLNGVPTQVQMQVIAMADATGRTLADLGTLTDPFEAVIDELKSIKRLLAVIAQEPELLIGNDEGDPVGSKR